MFLKYLKGILSVPFFGVNPYDQNNISLNQLRIYLVKSPYSKCQQEALYYLKQTSFTNNYVQISYKDLAELCKRSEPSMINAIAFWEKYNIIEVINNTSFTGKILSNGYVLHLDRLAIHPSHPQHIKHDTH